MASITERAGPGLRLPALPARFLALVAIAPVALGISRLLPDVGAGLGLRLAAASVCVLIVPGVLVLRALDWPRRLGLVLAGSLAWSLVAVFLALTLTFASGGSLSLTVVVVCVIAVGGVVAVLRAAPAPLEHRDLWPVAWVAVGGLALCGVVWWASTVVGGDALFHLARVRKLDEMPVLYSVNVVNELRSGGLDPGYAFPLWHGVLALIGRFAGVDPALVVLHLSAILTPFALVLAYAVGAALFVSPAGGAAAAIAVASLVGFQHDGIGAFAATAMPAPAARLLIVPALLALVFSFVRGSGRGRLLTIAAAAGVLVVVHPTYAVFVALPLGGFLLARMALARDGRADWKRIGGCIAALLVPTGLYFAWLWPVVADTESFLPSAEEKARRLLQYGGQLDVHGMSFSLSPEAISRGGPATVAALLCIPVAMLAARRRWAAYVLGGTLAILALLLIPPVFTTVADLSSLSHARQLALFLPLPFALAGAAALAGRLRITGCILGLALGIGLVLAYPSGGEGLLGDLGPAWATWVAAGGSAIALAVGRFIRLPVPDPGRYAVTAMALFAIPVAVVGFRDVTRDAPDPYALTPGLVEALNTVVPMRSTVFSQLETEYRIGAYAPVYVAAAPPAHVANTEANSPYDRRADVMEFFNRDDLSYLEKARLLSKYGASWLVLDKTRSIPDYVRFLPPPVYEDERYELISLRRPSE